MSRSRSGQEFARSNASCPTGLPYVSLPTIATSAHARMALMLISLADAVASVVRKAMRTGRTDCDCDWKRTVEFCPDLFALYTNEYWVSADVRSPPSRLSS